MTWQSVPLADHHDLTSFDCGEPEMNSWLFSSARRAVNQGSARVFVWVAPGSDEVVAYYSVSPTQVIRDELPSRMVGGLSVSPAYLIGRLAIQRQLQGRRLGEQLLRDALEKVVEASERGGGRLVVVEALNESKVGFYEQYGFKRAKPESLRLFMKIATVRRDLGISSVVVEASPELGLASINTTLPDGSGGPILANPDDLRAIAARLDELAESPGAEVNLIQIINEVLNHPR